MTEEFVPRHLPMRQAKQNHMTVSIGSTRSNKSIKKTLSSGKFALKKGSTEKLFDLSESMNPHLAPPLSKIGERRTRYTNICESH
ncbi:hypothetical protein H5410_006596 [Solanum commersonii]|uniref:Uncharacterized protein n=1 Tax=Solanum commersonii TaxID=4109 RepID=A0A9J6AAZ2_SOLCO|nr:hypothetical protein H5410_006596 [Solanum commersonii]